MDLLEERFSQLDGEIEEITSKIEQLYSRLDSEQDPSKSEKLEKRIKELKTEKRELNGQLEKLENKLQPGVFEADEKRKLDEVHQYIQEQKRAKSVLHLSNFKTVDMQKVAERAGLKFEEAELPEKKPKRGVQGFRWDERLEKAQHDRYMPHLKAILQPKDRGLTWVNAAVTEPSMLSYHSETLGINVRGTTDVAICTRTSVLGQSPQLGLKVLFELTKSAGKEATTKARITLLLANLHSPKLRPIVVLTDLNDWWMVFWLSEDTIYQFPFETRSHAVPFLEDFLGGKVTPDVTEGHADIAARAQISKALLSSEGLEIAVLKEQIESLEGVASRGDIDQLKVQGLMSLLHAMPTFPSWESEPPPFGMYN